eukprot:scpid69201/ scgid31441/ 
MSRCIGFPDNLRRNRLRNSDFPLDGDLRLRSDTADVLRVDNSSDDESKLGENGEGDDRGEVSDGFDDEDVCDGDVRDGSDLLNSADTAALPDGRGGHRRTKRKPHLPRSRRIAHEHGAGEVPGWSLIHAFCGGLLLGGVILFVSRYMNSSDSMFDAGSTHPSFPYAISPDQLKTSVTHLAERFATQPAFSWKAFSGRGAHHLKDASPIQPVIFFLAAYPEAYSTMTCLARSLARAFSNYSDVAVDASDIVSTVSGDGDRAKEILDSVLREKLSAQTTEPGSPHSPPVVLVENLQQLPPPSPFLFFSYCDSSDAVDPRAVFIFTLRLPSPSKGHTELSRPNKVIIDYLATDLWRENRHKDYDAGAVEALITRVTDVTILVEPEPSDLLTSATCDHSVKN